MSKTIKLVLTFQAEVSDYTDPEHPEFISEVGHAVSQTIECLLEEEGYESLPVNEFSQVKLWTREAFLKAVAQGADEVPKSG